MKRFQIKVCGNKNIENFKSLVNLSLDYVGFIFYRKSKRFVEDEEVLNIFPNAEKVGVFVNDSIQNILQKVKDYKLDIVQLHGDETPEFCRELISTKHQYLLTDERFIDFKIWKAVGIENESDFEKLTTYQQVVDSFLFDKKSDKYGGTGNKFNWRLLSDYKLSTPFFLSGGIKLEDAFLLRNFNHTKCIGFDINSGFESEPGIKKIDQVKQFIDIVDGRIGQN